MSRDKTQKLHPGQSLEPVTFNQLDGPEYTFGSHGKWEALFVFRGQHCPICKRYLAKLESRREAFAAIGVEIAVVSADTAAQTRVTHEACTPGFPLLYGMNMATMRALGLYENGGEKVGHGSGGRGSRRAAP